VCAKNHPDRLSRLATIHQRYRQTDRRTDFLWHRPRPNGRPKTLKINTISDALCLLKITQLTPRNEHTVAAPSEQHLTFKCAECKNTVSLNFDFSSTSQIFTFNILAYSVTLFSFTRGRHAHKFEIFTITVTTLHLQLISIFNHWPKTILSFTRGRHLCNFHSPGGATFSTVIRQGAPLKFRFSAFLKCPHPKAPTLISDPASLTNIPYT